MTHLYLGDHHVNGRLFDRFYFFRDLQQIWLDDNNITDVLPPSIGSLSGLTSIDLSNNHFVGSIPESWGSLTNLKRLRLRGNTGLTGTLPTALASLSHARFDFDGTEISSQFVNGAAASGNNGRAPYEASREAGSASTYPQQGRRMQNIAERFHHTAL